MAKRKAKKRSRTPRRTAHKRAAAPSARAVEVALAGIAHDIRTPLDRHRGARRIAGGVRSAPARTRMGERRQERRRSSRRAHHADRRCGREPKPPGLDAASRAVLAAPACRSGRAPRSPHAPRHVASSPTSPSPDDLPAMVAGDALRLRDGARKSRRQRSEVHRRKAASPSRRAPNLRRAIACGSFLRCPTAASG